MAFLIPEFKGYYYLNYVCDYNFFFSSESKTPTNANWVSRYCSREENRAYESDFLYIAGMMTKKNWNEGDGDGAKVYYTGNFKESIRPLLPPPPHLELCVQYKPDIFLSVNHFDKINSIYPRLDLVNLVVRPHLFTKLSLFTKSSLDKE